MIERSCSPGRHRYEAVNLDLGEVQYDTTLDKDSAAEIDMRSLVILATGHIGITLIHTALAAWLCPSSLSFVGRASCESQ